MKSCQAELTKFFECNIESMKNALYIFPENKVTNLNFQFVQNPNMSNLQWYKTSDNYSNNELIIKILIFCQSTNRMGLPFNVETIPQISVVFGGMWTSQWRLVIISYNLTHRHINMLKETDNNYMLYGTSSGTHNALMQQKYEFYWECMVITLLKNKCYNKSAI